MANIVRYFAACVILLTIFNCGTTLKVRRRACPKVADPKPVNCQYSKYASTCQNSSQCKPYKCCEQPCGNMACNKPVCKQLQCKKQCETGYSTNRNGCQTCRCRDGTCGDVMCRKDQVCQITQIYCIRAPCPNQVQCVPKSAAIADCSNVRCRACPAGSYNAQNTKTCCECTACPPVCKNACQYGRELDANGCETCTCKPEKECPKVKCIPCDGFYEIDDDGCQTCKCISVSCKNVTCSDNYSCQVIQPACFAQPCPPYTDCIENQTTEEPQQDSRCPAPKEGEMGFGAITCTVGQSCTVNEDGSDGMCCKNGFGGTACLAIPA